MLSMGPDVSAGWSDCLMKGIWKTLKSPAESGGTSGGSGRWGRKTYQMMRENENERRGDG